MDNVEELFKFLLDKESLLDISWYKGDNMSFSNICRNPNSEYCVVPRRHHDYGMLYNFTPEKYPKTLSLRVSVNDNNDILYKQLMDIMENISKLDKLSMCEIQLPKPIKEKTGIKPEYEGLVRNVHEWNERIKREYEFLLSKLEALGCDCASVTPPRLEYVPSFCSDWREYEDYTGCGVEITCHKKSKLYKCLLDSGLLEKYDGAKRLQGLAPVLY